MADCCVEVVPDEVFPAERVPSRQPLHAMRQTQSVVLAVLYALCSTLCTLTGWRLTVLFGRLVVHVCQGSPARPATEIVSSVVDRVDPTKTQTHADHLPFMRGSMIPFQLDPPPNASSVEPLASGAVPVVSGVLPSQPNPIRQPS